MLELGQLLGGVGCQGAELGLILAEAQLQVGAAGDGLLVLGQRAHPPSDQPLQLLPQRVHGHAWGDDAEPARDGRKVGVADNVASAAQAAVAELVAETNEETVEHDRAIQISGAQ